MTLANHERWKWSGILTPDHDSSPSTSTSASFFSSAVDILQRYAFFNFQPWLRLASMEPKPPTEFRFPLSADARNQRGPFDEQELARVPDHRARACWVYGELASSKTLASWESLRSSAARRRKSSTVRYFDRSHLFDNCA